ncbi:tRNA (adenosine(37)-N6)-threonylcarbamoyltransferase complex dimerization subunit type 1 TsaB [Paenibacillus wenxiniae]|uniref:tRNA (Adenosine(37)-N6)-threonylcarbamoyltransferase complex dimerization subunit type 1 TsaB n=1 Tax=Paenibacillus wenxiniae TaxID=1636843 RepID=A0ABW4RIB1_9BACL
MSEMNEQPRKRFLVLDTSTAAQVVAVMDEENVLAAESSNADRNHSVGLMDSIARMLDAASVSRRELDGIAVGVGPGSYTGIRIAVTTAKTLAWTLQLPVAGFSSLAALALSGYRQAGSSSESTTAVKQSSTRMEALDHGSTEDAIHHTGEQSSTIANAQYDETETQPIETTGHTAHLTTDTQQMPSAVTTSWIVPLMDARRGQVYTGLFTTTGTGVLVCVEADRIVLMDDWMDQLIERYDALSEQERPSSIYIVGDTALHEQRAAKLAELAGDRVILFACSLEAEDAGMVGAAALLSGQSEPAHTLLPNYTQLSEAEANLLRHS